MFFRPLNGSFSNKYIKYDINAGGGESSSSVISLQLIKFFEFQPQQRIFMSAKTGARSLLLLLQTEERDVSRLFLLADNFSTNFFSISKKHIFRVSFIPLSPKKSRKKCFSGEIKMNVSNLTSVKLEFELI